MIWRAPVPRRPSVSWQLLVNPRHLIDNEVRADPWYQERFPLSAGSLWVIKL